MFIDLVAIAIAMVTPCPYDEYIPEVPTYACYWDASDGEGQSYITWGGVYVDMSNVPADWKR